MAQSRADAIKPPAYLILENGIVFEGSAFGKIGETAGEVVFTTGMTGYLETLTDSNCYGQIIVQTFPLIGNYGVIPADLESDNIFAKAYIVKHLCQEPSNFRSEGSLDVFFEQKGIIGLSGIDTRKLTKIIREHGVMNGKITTAPPTAIDCKEAESYKIVNPVAACQVRRSLQKTIDSVNEGRNIAVFRYGATAEEFLGGNPDGIILAGGPGNPGDGEFAPVVDEIKKLIASGVPILGIGLGHQLLAIAHGYKTMKMKFGHRGANQPVKDLLTGRVYMSVQNHGYAVEADKSDKNAAFINVNDGTCEGLDYGKSFSVQFYPFGNHGDTAFVMERFIARMERVGE
jgi:carbamoyl-phosphate synthase small subunit